MKVSAIVVTRGDVDLRPVLDSFPPEWETLVWNNGSRMLEIWRSHRPEVQVEDVSVYGRYAAIEHATGDVIYVQDDDVLVSSPEALVEQFVVPLWARADHVVCNMPPEFRHDFYVDHALVGFGAVFHRDAPERAWRRWMAGRGYIAEWPPHPVHWLEPWFLRTCDIVFTGLTPRILADVPKTNLSWATDENRMYRQPEHVAERTRMLELVKEVARG